MLSWRVGVPHGACSGAGDTLAPALAACCPAKDIPMWVLPPSWVPRSPGVLELLLPALPPSRSKAGVMASTTPVALPERKSNINMNAGTVF